jgi:hypothetical protein
MTREFSQFDDQAARTKAIATLDSIELNDQDGQETCHFPFGCLKPDHFS